MAGYNRSIEIAFDRISGEVLEAEDLFNPKKEGFEVRKEYNRDQIDPYCCECGQKLGISDSKYNRIHFKHQKNADYCILKDENLSGSDRETFIEILKAKESVRHKELKNKIGIGLADVPDIDKDSITVDNKFIIRGQKKRRPDVYCRYKDKEIVFEIQLSKLSLRYILSRHDFYKEHGIYLIWILANFDVQDQSAFERDIKYLTHYHNFFTLDESVEDFRLLCEYKFPFLTYGNELHSKWVKKSIKLEEASFDEQALQIFYFDFNKSLLQTENDRKIRQLEIEEHVRLEKEKQRAVDQQNRKAARQTEIEKKCNEVIREVSRLHRHQSQVFHSARGMLMRMDEEELTYLNFKLQLDSFDKHDRPKFFSYLLSATYDDIPFIEFLMSGYLEFDSNTLSKEKLTAFQAILQNKNMGSFLLIKALFKKNYVLTQSDEISIRSIKEPHEADADISIYKLCSGLGNRIFVEDIFTYAKLICILQSAKERRIIGSNYRPNEWLAFGNNAISNYTAFWDWIELAFRHYGIWNLLEKSDHRKSFQKKLERLTKNYPQQDIRADRILKILYPEVNDQLDKKVGLVR